MFIEGLLLLLAASFLSAGRLLPQPESRIIGGRETNIESAPWQVSLRLSGKHYCGGVIYNETIIITAAHCFYHEHNLQKAEDFEVLAGSANKYASETIVKVAAIKHHSYKNMNDDIGIVKLRKPLDLTTQKMQKIALADKDPDPGTIAQVTGWGEVIRFLGDVPVIYRPDNLQAVDIKIQKLGDCDKVFGGVENGSICGGSEGLTTCYGDSGGPLVVNKKLVGVVSRGYCTSLTVYTSVSQLFGLI